MNTIKILCLGVLLLTSALLQAQKAGHKLTGKDRIVYLQMLFADTNIYELQIGIE